MNINQLEDEKAILKEIGNRLKQYRVSLNITQNQLSQRTGISVITIMRIENGEDTKWSTIIKILSELKLSENLDILIPEPKLDYKALFEEKTIRQRARPDKKKTDNAWVWGEDKEDE